VSRMSKEVLVDTSIWVEYFGGSKIGKKASKRYIDNPRYKLITSIITVAELSKHLSRGKKGFESFLIPEDLLRFLKMKGSILPINEKIAILGGELLGTSRFGKLGFADYLILASAIENSISKVITKEERWKEVNNHRGAKIGKKSLDLKVEVIRA